MGLEFENDFLIKSLIWNANREFGSNGIKWIRLRECKKKVFNESRENLEKGKEKLCLEKVENRKRNLVKYIK